jgi:glycosyltransferase involved in cell wall biosynthesis
MTFDRMALVIPAWNEARRLEDAAFLAFVASQELVDLHFVDDGSGDATPTRLAALATAAPGRITVQRLDPNRGKAEAVRAGLVAALAEGYPLVGYLDADLAAPLDTALLLRDELVRWPTVSLVLGSRVKLLGWRIRRSERRHYLGRLFATCASLTLALPVYDTQCGAKAMRAVPAVVEALRAPFLSRWLFDVELIARLRDGLGVAALREVPLPRWEDPGGSSVGLRDFLRAPLELWRIWRRYPPRGGSG